MHRFNYLVRQLLTRFYGALIPKPVKPEAVIDLESSLTVSSEVFPLIVENIFVEGS